MIGVTSSSTDEENQALSHPMTQSANPGKHFGEMQERHYTDATPFERTIRSKTDLSRRRHARLYLPAAWQ